MKFEKKTTILIFSLLILATLALRIGLYLLAPNNLLHSDNAIIGLMGKHILGGEFPVFFYGQPYMGGIEAYVAALLFSLFGMSIYTLALSPILHSVLFVATVYLLAKEICGEKNALWAMAYAAFPPAHLLFYGNVARGGYPGTLLWGNLVLLFTIKLLKQTGKSKKIILLYFLLGLVAGLGWWTNTLIVYYLLAAALCLLLADWRRLFVLNAVSGLTGFFLGSFPFWLYNLTHHFASFQISGSMKFAHVKPAIKKLLLHDLGTLFNIKIPLYPDNLIGIFIGCLYALSFLFFVIYSVPGFMAFFRKEQGNRDPKVLLLLFSFSIMTIYLLSHFSLLTTERYLLPLFSLVPIVLAWTFTQLPKHLKRMAALFFLFIILFNLYQTTLYFLTWKDECRQKAATFQEVLEVLKKNHITRVIAPYSFSQTITFLTDETIIASTPIDERYPLYKHLVEKSDDPALILKNTSIDSFLSTIGGSYKKDTIENFSIYHSFVPPQHKTISISPEQWKAWSNHGEGLVSGVFDRSADDLWTTIISKKPGMIYQLDLGQTYPVCRLRIFNRDHYNNFPTSFKIELSQDGSNWFEIIPSTPFSFYSWTGPRIYSWAENWHWDISFEPKTIRFIRIIQTGTNKKHPWEICELYVEKYIDEKTEQLTKSFEKKELLPLASFLKKRNITTVYADRWISANLPDLSNGTIKAVQSRMETTSLHSSEKGPTTLNLSEATALLVKNTYKSEVERILDDYYISYSTKDIGPWVCFMFKEPDIGPQLAKIGKSLYWTGFSVLKTNEKNASKYFYEKACAYVKKDHHDQALQFLTESISHYPNNFSALELLAEEYDKKGQPLHAQKIRGEIHERSFPEHESKISFANGVVFLGYSLDKPVYHPGDIITIKYYWKIKHPLAEQIMVFVHFSGKNRLFQNDHPFLQQHPHQGFSQPFPDEIFREEYTITIPEDSQPGKYKMGMGLFIPGDQGRIGITRTKLPHYDSKTRIGTITIVSDNK